MKKLAGLWLGYSALVLLTACVQKDDVEPLGPEPQSSQVGEAVIHLPALPPELLAKRSSASAEAMFILTLSGQGMVTRKHAWPLSSSSGTPIKVVNIPVGQRKFHGELELDGHITHSDSQWVPIESGKTAQVNLKLRATSGNANVCVEIEGFPSPVGCIKPPPAKVPDVSGCWRFTLGVVDTLSSHVLTIRQKDTQLVASIDWDHGGTDSSNGTIRPDGWIMLGQPFGGFYFHGSVDTNGRLFGKFYLNRTPAAPAQPLTGYRGDCKPIKPVDPSLTCYEVAQSLDAGGGNGRLVFRPKNGLQGAFQWRGYETMALTGTIGSVNRLKTLYMDGNLPEGLARPDSSGIDRVHYKGQISSDSLAAILNGTIYGMDASGEPGGQPRGMWKGYPASCTSTDGALLDKLHGR